MSIHEFKYIDADPKGENLKEKIEDFYIKNGKGNFVHHVNKVSEYAAKLADEINVDIEKCKISALIHDVSAVMRHEDYIRYGEKEEIEILNNERENPFLLHQKISGIIAKEVFCLEDEDIISPVICHTTLRPKPSLYDIVLFVADKLHRHTDIKPPYFNEVLEGFKSNPEGACLTIMEHYLRKGDIKYPHPWFNDAVTYLKQKVSR